MARYATEFHLTNPVNDLNAAREYLQVDNMAEYLSDDLRDLGLKRLKPSDILNLEWDLQDEDYGLIYLDTAIELTDDELDVISDWVRGQNSDGLGEGFEQQPFAEIRYEGDEDEYGYSDYDTDMASFDWQTNSYKFEKISDSKRVTDSLKRYSDLSYQDKQRELTVTYEYAFSFVMKNLADYVDVKNRRAVRDFFTEQVYIFMENDPMFDPEQLEMHGIDYDNQFAEDMVNMLMLIWEEEYN